MRYFASDYSIKMENTRILIVEDDPIISTMIRKMLEKKDYQIVGIAQDMTQAISLIKGNKIDVALLDIRIQGKKDGIDLAEKISKDFNFPFIFLTSNIDQETLDRVAEVGANGFLSKPFKESDLHMAIELAVQEENITTEVEADIFEKSLFVKEKGMYLRIPYQEIQWFKASGIYTEIHTIDNKRVIRSLLRTIAEKLPNDHFLRIHKSYIVNVSMIGRVDAKSVYISQQAIPISRDMQSVLVSKMQVI